MYIRNRFLIVATCVVGATALFLSPAYAKDNKVNKGGQVQQVHPVQQFHPAQPNFGQRTNTFGGSSRGFQSTGGGTQRGFGTSGGFGSQRGFGSGGGFGSSNRGFGTSRSFGSSRGFGNSRSFGSSRGFGRGFARGNFTYKGHSFRRFAAPRYRWPHGYGYHRYVIGGYLPRAFWSPDYYITDYVDFGVDAPPPDFQWVRYGPDLLLVNLDTGEVDQTVYGVFGQSGDASPDDGSADQPPGDQ
jgi:Ni/Co efflux regulator RcnB